MEIIEKIVKQLTPPSRTDVLWLNPETNKMMSYVNGEWVVVSSEEGGIDHLQDEIDKINHILGEGYQFMGIVDNDTILPDDPDSNMFYLAFNFVGTEVEILDGKFSLSRAGAWIIYNDADVWNLENIMFFGDICALEVTWEELISLRDDNMLEPGRQYRM